MAGQTMKPETDLHPSEMAAAAFEGHCQSVLDAESRMALFEQTGHGLFIWQAYKSAREATGSKDAAHVAMDALGLPDDISARLDAVTTRVLGLLDLVANEMVGMSGVTGAAQAEGLRRALLMDGDASPAKSRSMALRYQIIDLFEGYVAGLNQYRRIYEALPTAVQRDQAKPKCRAEVYRKIAAHVGCTAQHVRNTCEAYVDARRDSAPELAAAFRSRSTADAPAISKCKRRRGDRGTTTPSNLHPWRKTVKRPQ